MVPWRFGLEMSFLLPSFNIKNTQSNVQKEGNLEDVKLMNRRRTSQKSTPTKYRKARTTLHVKKLHLRLMLIHIHKATFLRKESNKEGTAPFSRWLTS